MLLSLTGTGKTVLLIVAITFIVFALVTALMIPKRNEKFPVNLTAYLLVCFALFAAQMGAVVWVTGTQEAEHEETAHGESTGEETTPAETTPTETTPAETTPAETEGDAEAGKAVFTANCVACHTLADANASGSVGPNLDETKPSGELVVDRVTNGKGTMPPFGDSLTEEQIADVAAYVSSVAGS